MAGSGPHLGVIKSSLGSRRSRERLAQHQAVWCGGRRREAARPAGGAGGAAAVRTHVFEKAPVVGSAEAVLSTRQDAGTSI